MTMAERFKEGLFVRLILSSMQPGLASFLIRRAITVTYNPLSFGKSKRIDARWHFVRD